MDLVRIKFAFHSRLYAKIKTFQLDDNRVPSETLVIKFFQDHLQNNDLKRIQTLREARRCFSRLSTAGSLNSCTFQLTGEYTDELFADIDDGCDFSKALSKCLNAELE